MLDYCCFRVLRYARKHGTFSLEAFRNHFQSQRFEKALGYLASHDMLEETTYGPKLYRVNVIGNIAYEAFLRSLIALLISIVSLLIGIAGLFSPTA